MPTALMKKIAKRREAMATGQLIPLKKRLTPAQQVKRQTKIVARRTALDKLESQQRQFMLGVANGLNKHFKRGFFGRIKFLLVGR